MKPFWLLYQPESSEWKRAHPRLCVWRCHEWLTVDCCVCIHHPSYSSPKLIRNSPDPDVIRHWRGNVAMPPTMHQVRISHHPVCLLSSMGYVFTVTAHRLMRNINTTNVIFLLTRKRKHIVVGGHPLAAPDCCRRDHPFRDDRLETSTQHPPRHQTAMAYCSRTIVDDIPQCIRWIIMHRGRERLVRWRSPLTNRRQWWHIRPHTLVHMGAHGHWVVAVGLYRPLSHFPQGVDVHHGAC